MLKYAVFNRFEIAMTLEDAESCSHSGRCDDDVAALLEDQAIASQLDAIVPDDIRYELAEYGAWDDYELADDEANRMRIVWIAAGDIVEGEC